MLIAFVFVVAVVAVFSDSAIGRALRESLRRFKAPRPTRGHFAVAILLIVFATTLVAVLKSDGLALAARTLPDGMAWIAAFDVATYLDVVMLAALATLALRLRLVWTFVRGAASLCARAFRAVLNQRGARTHRRPRAAPSKSDDDEGWLGGGAFA